jgi:glycosyltransferase involved in cell wall biosynthesis
MPTLNSERTIGKTLKSICSQSFPKNQYEILVIDGGSTDKTVDIAKKFGAIILKNELKIPETAKTIGIKNARGKYIILHDSDEVYTKKNQLSKRYEFFKNNPDVYCYLTNKLIPGRNCGISCAYLNLVSDPFSFIVYKNKGCICDNNKKYLYKQNKGSIYKFEEGDLLPIGDGGSTTINLDKAKEIFGDEIYTQDFAVSIFTRMVKSTKLVGCMEEDAIIHNSTAKLNQFLKKLRFRININLNNVEKSGYSARAGHDERLQKRKKWFIIYGLSIVGPIWDSFRLAIKFKRPSLILHFFYTYYVCVVAVIEVLKKKLRIKGGNYSYGK